MRQSIGLVGLGILATAISAEAHQLTFDQLASAIQKNDLRSVRATFEELGPSSFDLMAILQTSASLQEAVPATSSQPPLPRVILADKEAKFIIAFNGQGAGITGTESLDVFELDPKLRAYTPSVVEFDPAGLAPPIRVAKNVPQACAECHFPLIGSHPHPDFLDLPFAPSLFGSLSGHLSPDEKANLKAFVGSPQFSTQYQIVEKVARRTHRDLDTVGEQAKEMGRQITENVFDGYSLAVTQVPQFRPYRYAFLGALVCKDFDPAQYIPAAVSAKFTITLANAAQTVQTYRQEDFDDGLTTWKTVNPSGDPALVSTLDDPGSGVEYAYEYLSQNILTVANGFPKNYNWFSETLTLQSESGRLRNLAPYLAKDVLNEGPDRGLGAIFQLAAWLRPNRTDLFTLGAFEPSTCRELSSRSLAALTP